MPYIPQEGRASLLSRKASPVTSGGLNFLLTSTILAYLMDKGVGYETMNSIVGALDQVKDEFQRRVIHPYEANSLIHEVGLTAVTSQLFMLHAPPLILGAQVFNVLVVYFVTLQTFRKGE